MKSSKHLINRNNPRIKLIRLKDGRWGVRIRDEDGKPVKLTRKLGRIYGALDADGRKSKAYQASLRAVSSALARSNRRENSREDQKATLPMRGKGGTAHAAVHDVVD